MGTFKAERYLLSLLGLKGIGPGAVKKNLAKIESAIVASDVFEALMPVIGGRVGEGAWRAALAQADQALDRCKAVGVTAISILDRQYPKRLMELATPPPVLFCRGNLTLLSRPILGVIGARKSTHFGETVARRIGSYLSGKGTSICNGLADGIDICSVAPEGSILPHTIGLMGAGLDLVEVKLTSKRTAERARNLLEAGGLLLSELPPGAVEDQNTVIASCRLQAGMSQVLLLVQSSNDGGSRFTVKHFCNLPRQLAYVVPPAAQLSDRAFGANSLLLQGHNGLAEFVGLKTTESLKVNLMAIRSRDDYNSVLRELDG